MSFDSVFDLLDGGVIETVVEESKSEPERWRAASGLLLTSLGEQVLPAELWAEILQYRTPQAQVRMTLLSTTWKKYGWSCLPRINFNDVPALADRKSVFYHLLEETDENTTAQPRYLSALVIRSWGFLNHIVFAKMCRSLAYLRHLSLECATIWAEDLPHMSQLKSLESISLAHIPDLRILHGRALASLDLPRLTDLTVVSCGAITVPNAIYEMRLLTRLTTLRLTECASFSSLDPTLDHGMPPHDLLPNLTSLDLTKINAHDAGISPSALLPMFTAVGGKLRALSLQGVEFTSVHLDHLATLPALERLIVQLYHRSLADAMKSFPRMKALKCLTVRIGMGLWLDDGLYDQRQQMVQDLRKHGIVAKMFVR